MIAVIILFSIIISIGGGLYYLKKDSATGKLLIWEVTLGKIIEKPLAGHGLGRFEAGYNNWQAEYFQQHPGEINGPKGRVAGNTKYAFNEYLEMASETGIIGLLLFTGIAGPLLISMRKTGTDREKINKSNEISNAFKASLLTILVCAAISFSFYSLPTLVLLGITMGIATNRKEARYNLETRRLTARFALSGLLFALTIPCAARLQKIPSYKKWKDAFSMYTMSGYTAANDYFREIIPSLACKGEFWQQYGKSLQMNGNNKESVNALEKASRYTSDYILYTTLGDAYKGIKKYSDAEASYRHAAYMEPNKFYPRYLLAKLYDETGQKQKALKTAKEVLTKQVKVQSTAIKEIKIEMKKIINKY
jgi:hypothetical protein